MDEIEEYLKQLRTVGVERYSTANRMLLLRQLQTRDDVDLGSAKYFHGYNTWSDKYGRQVSKGSDGYKIRAPRTLERCTGCEDSKSNHSGDSPCDGEEWETIQFFQFITVFEYSQTEPIPKEADEDWKTTLDDVEADEVWEPEDRDAQATQVDAEAINSNVRELIESEGVDIQDYEKDDLDGLQASKSVGDTRGVSTGGKVTLLEDMDKATETQVLLHELAHERLHQADVVELDRETKEVEAETVAYLVCQQLGIETKSEGYVANWADSSDVWRRFKMVIETAEEILDSL